MVEEVRTIKLNILELTDAKETTLQNLLDACIDAGNTLLEVSDEYETRYSLQEGEYESIKEEFGLHSQIIVDLCKDAFVASQNDGGSFSKYAIPYNVPRSGGFAETNNGNPVISVATLKDRLGLPIVQDGAWHRFNELLENGYEFTSFRLKKTRDGWIVLVPLKREVKQSGSADSIIGVDVGSRTLASITILGREKVRKQLYFGRDVWEKQRNISTRRASLQSYADKGSSKARRTLRKLKDYESNFTQTRCYQVAHKIVKLAKKHHSLIAIEDLNGLKDAEGHRKSNRRTKRMPYHKFRAALEQVCAREGIGLITVDPYHTSKSCPQCGEIGKRLNGGVNFKCGNCGYEANADRVASLNIALRAGQTISDSRTGSSQSSQGSVPVNGHDWRDLGVEIMSSHDYSPPERKPLPSGRGS